MVIAGGGGSWLSRRASFSSFNGAGDGDRRRARSRAPGCASRSASTEPAMVIAGGRIDLVVFGDTGGELQRSRRW